MDDASASDDDSHDQANIEKVTLQLMMVNVYLLGSLIAA